MSKESIFACGGFAHGASTIAGVTHGKITPITVTRRDPIAKKSVVTDKDLVIEVYGNNARELYDLIGDAAANGVFTVVGRAGASETHTVKNVYFDQVLAPVDIPEADGGGKLATAGIRGICEWGGEDTFATMWT